MQLNGTEGFIMAASDPPEPPPRNPDKIKINASLKQTSETVIHTLNINHSHVPCNLCNPFVYFI